MKRKRTPTRFRLPYTRRQAYDMLLAACRAEVVSRRREFAATEGFLRHVMDAASWLTSEEPTFGLFLCGSAGNGKTTLLRALQSLVRWLRRNDRERDDLPYVSGFEIVGAKELVLLAKAYNGQTRDNRPETGRYKRLRDMEVLAIDDLGSEPVESMVYGESVTTVMDLMSYRYDMQLTTLATSNISADRIKDRYDNRMADRFREMMRVINFGNEPSFRK